MSRSHDLWQFEFIAKKNVRCQRAKITLIISNDGEEKNVYEHSDNDQFHFNDNNHEDSH